MTILFLSDFCPWPLDNGYRQRVYHLVQSLARVHSVTLATVMPPALRGQPFPPAQNCVDLVPLSDADCVFRHTNDFERWAPAARRLSSLVTSPYPNVIRRYRSGEIGRALVELSRRSFDVVWAERPFIAELARRAGFRRIAIDLPDIESVSFSRELNHSGWYPSKPLHLLDLAKLYAYDQAMPLRFWRLIVCKEEDRLFFRLRRSNVVTLPNGVDEYPASPDVINTPTPQLLFVGALNFEPNIAAVQFFTGSVLPLVRREYPAVDFVVIGSDPLSVILDLHKRRECRVLTSVPDLTPHFDAASLFVAPIHLGSGTRLKVLEAMARGKAVVATSVAAEGLNVRSGIDLEIADSPAAFAAACCRLLGDAEARRRIGVSGRTRVLDRYRWSHLTEIAETALSDRLQPRY